MMLVPFVIDLLIGCSLLLLAGWASDAIRAGRHDGRRDLDSVGPTGWNQMGRPRNPWPYDDPNATWMARPLRQYL